ncbi:hypothetical protein [Litorisediminicola beolgyonensis]|uniref:Heme oxygenase n=1 Tax=Litorisediminicola beolgyonensis TaxID=1173614 RepID=A0ABW3ZM75_9RHOB
MESLFSPFMDDPAPLMSRFLSAQLIAARALRRGRDGAPPAEEAATLSDMIAALEGDLGDAASRLPDIALPRPLDTLAVGYIVLGSRLGTEVLARRLTALALPLPLYFRLPPPGGAWTAFRARLDALVPDQPMAQRIATDAALGFDIYAASARLAGLGAEGVTDGP